MFLLRESLIFRQKNVLGMGNVLLLRVSCIFRQKMFFGEGKRALIVGVVNFALTKLFFR